jgi:DNA replication protein DnaC
MVKSIKEIIMSMNFFNSDIQEIKVCNKHKIEYASYMFKSENDDERWTNCYACHEENAHERLRKEHLQEQIACKQRFITKLFKQSAIPPRFADVNFSNYIIDNNEQKIVKDCMIEFAKNIDDNLKIGRNIMLAGNSGTGKTHLSIAMAKIAIEYGYTALFTTVGEMIDKINEAGWNKATAIDNYTVPDLLILDEITYMLNNEEQKNLFKIINKRYELIKSTIILTNLSIAQWKNLLGFRITDRMRQDKSMILYFTWESYRK